MIQPAIGIPNGIIRNKDGMKGFYHWVVLDGQAVHIPDLRAWTPVGDIEVRFYHPNWSITDATVWGKHCSDEYAKDRGGWSMASMGCRVTVANEQNIEPFGTYAGREWYQKINDWHVACYNSIKAQGKIPLNKLDWPALAPGHSDDDNTRGFVGLEICRPAIELYLSGGGSIHCHVYWFASDPNRPNLTALDLCVDAWYGHRFILTHNLFPTAKIRITEYGGFDTKRATAPQEYVKFLKSLEAYPYVLWAAGFIWETPYGDHWQNDWSANPKIAEAVLAMASSGDIQVGEGFRKVEYLVGPWLESQIYHWAGSDHEVAMAVGQRGFATWYKQRNETYAALSNGEVWADLGNYGDGQLKRIR